MRKLDTWWTRLIAFAVLAILMNIAFIMIVIKIYKPIDQNHNVVDRDSTCVVERN